MAQLYCNELYYNFRQSCYRQYGLNKLSAFFYSPSMLKRFNNDNLSSTPRSLDEDESLNRNFNPNFSITHGTELKHFFSTIKRERKYGKTNQVI